MYQSLLTVCKRKSTSFYADKLRKVINVCDEDRLVYIKSINYVFNEISLLNLSFNEKIKLSKDLFSSVRCEYEILQDLFEDEHISEIMVNGIDNVFIEKNGQLIKTDIHLDSAAQLKRIIQRLVSKVGREMNDLNPIVDARLSDGSRINAVNDNIAVNGPILTVRKFLKDRLSMEDLLQNGCISREASLFLISLVRSGYNIILSGGTSSGKTTFLNILSNYIPKDERIIVIEDSAELLIQGHENLVRLEARQLSRGKNNISIKDLIKASLRMRPDRIIVGEVRGEEVVDMIAAMSTGHDGSLSTAHANSPRGLIGRLVSMHISSSNFPELSVKSQICDAVEIIVQLRRLSNGKRFVTEIAELDGIERENINMRTLFSFDYEKEKLVKRMDLKNNGKLDRLQYIHTEL